jgi:hypothetical protein
VCRVISSDPSNCGGCGNICPGYGAATADAICQNSVCGLTCKGGYYDVNNNPTDGCEMFDTLAEKRVQDKSISLGNHSCFDDNGGIFNGVMYSDARSHQNPSAPGFDPAVGAAPHWFLINATGGGGCVNDLQVDLVMGGTSDCYRLSVYTNLKQASVPIKSAGPGQPNRASITLGVSSYTDNSQIFFKVEKTCGPNVREVAEYGASYHL